MVQKSRIDYLSITIAFKVIALADDMTTAERQVGATLLDSFNRKTGQCDPSLDRLARLLNVHRRTVSRVISKLEAKGLFRKIRHGGYSHRNQYEPIWTKFVDLETKWRSRFAAAARHRRTEMSRLPGQDGPAAVGKNATQTCSSNQSNLTLGHYRSSEAGNDTTLSSAGKGSATKGPGSTNWTPTCFVRPPTVRSADAARAAAERRWSHDLWQRFASRADLYASLVDFIDEPIRALATDAELRTRGRGLALLIERYEAGDVDAGCTANQ